MDRTMAVKRSSAKKAPPIRIPKRPTPPERIPRVIVAPTLDDHLEIIARAVFQAGHSWAMIDAAWDAYRAAFDGFDARTVARYREGDVERILHAERVMRSRAKIEGTIRNAQALLALEHEFGSVRAYHESFASYDDARKDAKTRFAYMGDLNVYYWRFRTGAAVPPFEEWLKGQERDHPRMREMVTLSENLHARTRPAGP
jgi:3-methyladenine DNA glycosylase Tag